MADTAKAYKKFLLQRSVLDTLRLYLDVTDDFLGHMQHSSLLNDDDLLIVRGLRWPSNRNELLQILVRKPWNKSSFKMFCGVLRQTQGGKLTDMFVHKADDFIEEQTAQQHHVDNYKDPYAGLVDHQLGGLNMQAKNTVRSLLGEKDDQVRALKAENEELRNHIRNLTADNGELKQQLHTLDKAVTNTLAVMHLDGNHDTIEAGMRELQDRLTSQESQICDLQEDNAQMKVTIADLRSKLTVMTDDNIGLRELNTSLQEKLDLHLATSSGEIESLRAALKAEQANLAKTKKKAESSDALYRGNIQMLQQEMTKISEQMLKTARELDSTGKERDRARGEMAAVNERTRKLLFSLDLTKDTNADASLALDHARNMVYVQRRRGSVAPLGAQTAVSQTSGSNTNRSDPDSVSTDRSSKQQQQPQQYGHTSKRHGSLSTSRGQHNGSNTTPRRGSMVNGRVNKQHSQRQRQQHQQLQQQQPASPKSQTGSSSGTANSGHSTDGATALEEKLAKQTLHEDVEGETISSTTQQQAAQKCDLCGKQFQEVSNFDGACIFHAPDARKLNVGTELEVWSCCKSRDTYKGCQKARHVCAGQA